MYILKVPQQLLFNQLIYGSCDSATFIDALKQIDYIPCCRQTYGYAGHDCTIDVIHATRYTLHAVYKSVALKTPDYTQKHVRS